MAEESVGEQFPVWFRCPVEMEVDKRSSYSFRLFGRRSFRSTA